MICASASPVATPELRACRARRSGASGHAWRALARGLSTGLALLVFRSARADDAADTAAARLLGWDGVTMADAGNCEQAIEKLRRAEKLHHAPTTSGRLGECEVDTGKVVAGTERLQRLTHESLPPGAPAAFVDAVARARIVLERALPRVAVLHVSVHAPAGIRFVVTVDGESLPDALVDNDRPSDPGLHKVKATARGFFSSSKEIILGDGETKNLSLELERDPNAPRYEIARFPATDGDTQSRASAESPSHAAPIVAFSIGALGLGVGIGAGLAVAGKATDLAGSCDSSNVCPTSKQPEINSARTWAMVSTTGFIVGGVGIGTGLMLLLAERGGGHDRSTRAQLGPVVGPTYLGLHGGF